MPISPASAHGRITRKMALLALGVMLCAPLAQAKPLTVETEAAKVRITTIASGLRNPWGLAFLPDGNMLVTERSGDMRIVGADGKKSAPLKGLPEIISRGQGGLLDVTLAPDFAESRKVYFSYSEPGTGGTSSTAVAHGILADGELKSVTRIFSQQPKINSNGHYGSRLIFNPDGTLFIALGDRRHGMEDAQTLDNHHGKVIRVNADGSVPKDNPFVDTEGALPDIWSYGHRNIQGADLHPVTGELWTGEHGPQGGDEINVTRAAKNYGWPVITYGENYGGGAIGEGLTHKEGMEQPLHYWVPSIANAGMTFYTADKIPGWKGNLLVTGLRSQMLARLVLDGEKVTHEERLFNSEIGERLRHIVQGPDGLLYLLTDERNGKILRIEPAQ